MEKELVRNFGQSGLVDHPDDIVIKDVGLDKEIIKKFDDEDK